MTTAVAPEEQTLPVLSPASSPNRRQTIVLHDGGNVVLVVGEAEGTQQPIQTSKTVMSLASPVWKAMFSQIWAEHEASEISLPDDDVEAMLLVLRIAHLQFQDLPKKHLSLDSLLNLAVVCDKYDLVHLVRPFLEFYSWDKPWFPIIPEKALAKSNNLPARSTAKPITVPYARNTNPVWLFIAWTFGYGASFTSLAEYLVTRIYTGPEGAPMVAGQQFPVYMPPGLLNKMLDLRREALASILDVCYANLEEALHGKICKQNPPSEADCRCMIVGSYIIFLSEKKLYPERLQAVHLSLSVQELSNKFDTLEICTHDSHDYGALRRAPDRFSGGFSTRAVSREDFIGSGITSHRACGEVIDVAARAKQIISQLPSPVLEAHRVHMETQARK